jgi:hypothetical protein
MARLDWMRSCMARNCTLCSGAARAKATSLWLGDGLDGTHRKAAMDVEPDFCGQWEETKTEADPLRG